MSRLHRWFDRNLHRWRVTRWLLGDAYWADEGFNVFFLAGNPHESTSAHCGAQELAAQAGTGRECVACRLICWFIQRVLSRRWPTLKHHCANAYRAEKQMLADAPELP